MKSIVGPVLAYWASDATFQQKWVYLKSSQQESTHKWEYSAFIVDPHGSNHELVVVAETIKMYVADPQKEQCYALILAPLPEGLKGELSAPVRVIFAKSLEKDSDAYMPRSFAEIWKGASEKNWHPSQKHRSVKYQLPNHLFQPFTHLNIGTPPSLIAAEPVSPVPIAAAPLFDELIAQLEVRSASYVSALPEEIENQHFYLISPEELLGDHMLYVQFAPQVVIRRALGLDEITQPAIQSLIKEGSQKECSYDGMTEREITREASEIIAGIKPEEKIDDNSRDLSFEAVIAGPSIVDGQTFQRENSLFLSESATTLNSQDNNLSVSSDEETQHTVIPLRTLEAIVSGDHEDCHSPPRFIDIVKEKQQWLRELNEMLWGFTAAHKHTIIAVLANDWVLIDAENMKLTKQEQQAALAYLITRSKPSKKIPYFETREDLESYRGHTPHTDYLLYEKEETQLKKESVYAEVIENPLNINHAQKEAQLIYGNVLGHEEVWPISNHLMVESDILSARLAERESNNKSSKGEQQAQETLLLDESLIKTWVDKKYRPFPREFNPIVESFLHQFLFPSGMAALFANDLSRENNGPTVGAIDTFYQYLLLQTLRQLGYDGPIAPTKLPESVAKQKPAQLQEHFGAQRLIYQGLSQRGAAIYQNIIGAIYNPQILSEYSLENLNHLEQACQMMLDRNSADSDVFEASNDILVTIQVIEEAEADENDLIGIHSEPQDPRDALENSLASLIADIARYRFYCLLKSRLIEKKGQEFYTNHMQSLVQRFFEMIQQYRAQFYTPSQPIYALWAEIYQTCLDMIGSEPISEPHQRACVIARAHWSQAFSTQYPRFFFDSVRSKTYNWDALSALSMYKKLISDNELYPQFNQGSALFPTNMQTMLNTEPVVGQFYKEAQSLMHEDEECFEKVRAILNGSMPHHEIFFTPADQQFYASVLNYLAMSRQFYLNCLHQSRFTDDICVNLEEYFKNITPLLNCLEQSGLLTETQAHFFYKKNAKNSQYPISATVLKILSQNLPEQRDNILLGRFKEQFRAVMLLRVKQSQKEQSDAFLQELSEPGRGEFYLEKLRGYCLEIDQAHVSFLHKVLKKTSFQELREIVRCFYNIGQHDQHTLNYLTYLQHFMDLLDSLEQAHHHHKLFNDHIQLLNNFFDADQQLIEAVERIEGLDKTELMGVAEKLFQNIQGTVTVATVLSSYQSPQRLATNEAWLRLFQQVFIKRIQTLSREILQSFNDGHLHQYSGVSEQNFRSKISQVYYCERDTLLDLIQQTPRKYWPVLRDVIPYNLSAWKTELHQSMSDESEITFILEVLGFIDKIIDHQDKIEHIENFINYISAQIPELPRSEYDWVDQLLTIFVQQIDNQQLCSRIWGVLQPQEILSPLPNPPSAGHINIDEHLTSESLEEQRTPPPATVVSNTGVVVGDDDDPFAQAFDFDDIGTIMSQTPSSVEGNENPHSSFVDGVDTQFISQRLRQCLQKHRLSLSERSCDRIYQVYLRNNTERFVSLAPQHWAEVVDLSQEYLLQWLGSFHNKPEIFAYIIPLLMQLESVRSSSLNLWALFDQLRWNKRLCYSLLLKSSYQDPRLSDTEHFCALQRSFEKTYLVQANLEAILNTMPSDSSLKSLSYYLQRHHLIFIQQWVPYLSGYIKANVEKWIQTKEDFVLAVHWFGLETTYKLWENHPTLRENFLLTHLPLMFYGRSDNHVDKSRYPRLNLRDRALIQQYITNPALNEVVSVPLLMPSSQLLPLENFATEHLQKRWTLHERQEYFQRHVGTIAIALRQGQYNLMEILVLFSYLNKEEAATLEEPLLSCLNQQTEEEVDHLFQNVFDNSAQAYSFIHHIENLPPKAQVSLVKKGFTGRNFSGKELSHSQFILWKDFFFNLLNERLTHTPDITQLTQHFEVLLSNSRLFHQIAPAAAEQTEHHPLGGRQEALMSLWNYTWNNLHHTTSPPNLLLEIVRLIKVVCDHLDKVLSHPSDRDLVHDILIATPPEMMKFWDTQAYAAIDCAEIFEIVFHKLRASEQAEIFEYCKRSFVPWVHNIADLRALLHCCNAVQQQDLLSQITYAPDLVESAHDFCLLLKVLHNSTVDDVLQKWPIYLWMHTACDYFEILQQLSNLNRMQPFFEKYHQEFYAIPTQPDYIMADQWQRLEPKMCQLIMLVQQFPKKKLGLQLCDQLLKLDEESRLDIFPIESCLEKDELATIVEALQESYGNDWYHFVYDHCKDFWFFILQPYLPIVNASQSQMLMLSVPTPTSTMAVSNGPPQTSQTAGHRRQFSTDLNG